MALNGTNCWSTRPPSHLHDCLITTRNSFSCSQPSHCSYTLTRYLGNNHSQWLGGGRWLTSVSWGQSWTTTKDTYSKPLLTAGQTSTSLLSDRELHFAAFGNFQHKAKICENQNASGTKHRRQQLPKKEDKAGNTRRMCLLALSSYSDISAMRGCVWSLLPRPNLPSFTTARPILHWEFLDFGMALKAPMSQSLSPMVVKRLAVCMCLWLQSLFLLRVHAKCGIVNWRLRPQMIIIVIIVANSWHLSKLA